MPPNASISQLASILRVYKPVTPLTPASLPVPLALADPPTSADGHNCVRVDRVVARASRTRDIAVRTSRLPSTARRTSAVSCSSPNVSHHCDKLSASADSATGADHVGGALGTGGW